MMALNGNWEITQTYVGAQSMPYSTDTHSTSAEGDYNGDFSSDDVNAWKGLSGSAK